MTEQHTPAPWLYERLDDITEAIVTDEGDSICDVRGASEADLRLIANAPALLDALQALTAAVTQYVNGHEDWPEMEAAHAAINKATGKE